MKNDKDFDVNQFAPDGSTTETTAATGDTQQSKRSVSTTTTATSELTVQYGVTGKTAPTPPSGQAVKPRQTASTSPREQSVPSQQSASAQSIESTEPTQPIQPHRLSSRQRRASLDEYREAFLIAPKIIDRQSVFVSRDVRDRIDSVVRRLGEWKMSVSGFLENLARHHLELYADDLEQWRRL